MLKGLSFVVGRSLKNLANKLVSFVFCFIFGSIIPKCASRFASNNEFAIRAKREMV